MNTVIFTQRVEIIESYNERRDCADQRISEFIRACGYLPLPVPNNPSIVSEIVREVNPAGIILVGGNSLVKYGGNAPERDRTDALLIKTAVEKKIPIYGFCRGMQSILDYFGNELTKVPGHVAVRHEIIGEEEKDIVNSYHNEVCLELANDELIAVMRSADGAIEKIKHKNLSIIGTMWHPEREEPFRENDIVMVRSFYGQD